MADRIQLRRDTKANWEQYNPILLEGEPGHVLDYPNLYKMGDGVHAWNDLPYRGYNGNVTQEVQNDVNSVPSGAAIHSALKDSTKGYVDDEPTAGSENLVKSGGVAKNLAIFNGIAKGNTIVYSPRYQVKAGNIYKIWIKNPSINCSHVTEVGPTKTKFAVRALKADGSGVSSPIDVKMLDTTTPLDDSYVFQIPSNGAYMEMLMRANDGELQTVWIEDITTVTSELLKRGLIINENYTATSGESFDETIEVKLTQGDKLNLSVNTDAFDAFKLYLINNGTSGTAIICNVNTSIDLTVPNDITAVRIQKSGISSTGSVNIQIKTGEYAKIADISNEVSEISNEVSEISNEVSRISTELSIVVETCVYEDDLDELLCEGHSVLSVQTTQNVLLQEDIKLDTPLMKGTVLKFYGITSGLVLNNAVTLQVLNYDGGQSMTYDGSPVTVVLSSTYDTIRIRRSAGGVVATGTLSINYINYGIVKSEISQSIVSKWISVDMPTTSGSAFEYTHPISLEKGRGISLGLVGGSSDVISSKSVGVKLNYTDGTNKTLQVIFGNHVSTPMTLEKDIESITITSNDVIKTSYIQLRVFIWPFFTVTKPCYMSLTGNDKNNDGMTPDSPVRTLGRALSISNNVIIRGGEYDDSQLDLSLIKGKDIRLTAYNGELPILMNRQILVSSATVYSGNVYSASLSEKPTVKWLWHHLVDDISTSISEEELHPLQKGQYYRCDSTKIKEVDDDNITDVASAVAYMNQQYTENNFLWYYDNGTLYFTTTEAPTSSHPICIHKSDIIFGVNNGNTLNIEGISFYYGNVVLNNVNNSQFVNCASKYGIGNGAFYWNNCKNVTFKKCEGAGNIQSNNTSGDGFNGHTNIMDVEVVGDDAYLIDCWSHDNNDDGYSDHNGCVVTLSGGLYEYNQKGGVTPSYGTHCCCYNVLSRKNINGFYYIGTVADEGISGNAICYNCISKDNTNNGFWANGRKNGIHTTLTLMNCISINNGRYGYSGEPTEGSAANGLVYAYDCTANGNVVGAKDNDYVVAYNGQSL